MQDTKAEGGLLHVRPAKHGCRSVCRGSSGRLPGRASIRPVLDVHRAGNRHRLGQQRGLPGQRPLSRAGMDQNAVQRQLCSSCQAQRRYCMATAIVSCPCVDDTFAA